MNRSIKAFALGFAALSLVVSCSKSPSGAKGTVSFMLSPDTEIAVLTKSSVADYTTIPSAKDFNISVTDSGDETTSITDPQNPTELSVGSYTATASYGSTTEEGFNKPCFSGTQQFTVTSGHDTQVTVGVKLANALVRLSYTDNFKKYYPSYSFTLTTGKGTAIAFSASETRAAFVDAYLVKIKGILTDQGGKPHVFTEKEYKNLQAATCYTINFDASNIGGATLTISFNDTVETVDLGQIELND